MSTNFTILCPIDFSECSLNALEYASKLGEKYKAHLVIFHVRNPLEYKKIAPLDPEGNHQREYIEKKIKSLQDVVLQESFGNGLVSCEIAMADGPIVEETLAFAREVQASLIVVGAEGLSEIKDHLFGSRASSMVMKSEYDVLVVPKKAFFKRPRKLVYASDYIAEDALALQKIVEMANFYSSEVDAVHISSRHRVIDKALHASMVAEIKPQFHYPMMRFVLKSFRDDLALGLENYLHLAKGDILVCLAKKKNFFDQLFTNNLSRKMSYFISKPLWVVKTF